MKEKKRQDALKTVLVTEETEKEPKTEKTKKDSVSGKTAETAASGENVVVPNEGKDIEKVAKAAPEEVNEESGDKEEKMEEFLSFSTRDLTFDIEDPAANSNNKEENNEVDSSKFDEMDIKMVMLFADVARKQAVKALLRNNNQCFEAIFELTK